MGNCLNDLDLKDVEIKTSDGTKLRRLESANLVIVESGEGISAEIPGINLSVVAENREELIELIGELIAVHWEEYALEEDTELTARARDLKESLLRDYREIS